MARKSKACLFCGSLGLLTNEHALPKWARRAIGATEQIQLHVEPPGERSLSLPSGPPRQTLTGMTVLAREVVCEPCNIGWMARLEREVGPLLAPAMRGESIRLSPEQQTLVAFWAVKTSLMVEVAARRSRETGVLPISHLRWLHDHREDHNLPPGTAVWLGSLNPWLGSDLVPTWYSSGTLQSHDPRVPEGGTNDSYVATVSVGCLIFQVVGQDFRESDYRTPNGLPVVTVIPPRKLAPYLLQIWPQLYPFAYWPPSHLILAEEWPRFAEWFTTLSFFHRTDLATGEISGIFMAEKRGAVPKPPRGSPPRSHRSPPRGA
jgi:hypothetical protein